MRFSLGYAGIPAGEAYDYVHKMHRALIGGNSDFIGFPMKKHDGLSSQHAKLFLSEFKSRLDSEFDTSTNFMNTCCAVIYCSSDNDSNISFENHFFPAVLTVPVSWKPSGTTPEERRIAEKNLFESLLEATVKTRAILSVLHNELREQANKTPLLLPLRNFSSKSYKNWLRELQTKITASCDGQVARSVLNAATKDFEQKHPRSPGTAKMLSYYDDRKIEFKAPGAARRMHGRHRGDSEHPNAMCHLSGFRRLGAPFNAAFHYDAQIDSPKKLKGLFCQCHGDFEWLTGDPHLNIAPSDFTRI